MLPIEIAGRRSKGIVMKKNLRKLSLMRETLYQMGLLAQAAGGIAPQTVVCTLTACYRTNQFCNGGGSGAYTCDACTGPTVCETGGACTAGVITNCAC